MMNSNLEQIQERQRVRARIVSLATVVCLTAAMFTVTAFAANTETAQGFQQITSAGKTILKGIWDMLQAITAPLALVGIGFNVVKALLGTERAWKVQGQHHQDSVCCWRHLPCSAVRYDRYRRDWQYC